MIRTLARKLTAAWEGWARFFSRQEDASCLALFRIACGLCVVTEVAPLALGGLVEIVWVDAAFGGYRELDQVNWLVTAAGGAAPGVVYVIIGTCLAASAALVMGWCGRVAALLCLQMYIALMSLNRDVTSSYTLLISNALWLLVWARSSQTLSLACRMRTGSWMSDTPVPAWPRYLAAFQLVLMYFSSALHKVGSDWPLGGGLSAIYYTLQQPAWQRFDMTWLAWVYPLTQIATAVSWAFELTSPVWLLAIYFHEAPERDGRLRRVFRRLHIRGVFLTLGILFHVQILVFMRVGNFSWISLAYYLCLLTPQDVLRGIARWRNSPIKSRDTSTGQMA